MRALKIRIKSPQHSRRVQHALFLMGYAWSGKSHEIRSIQAPFLYAEENGEIKYSGHKGYDFETDPNEEVELGNESSEN